MFGPITTETNQQTINHFAGSQLAGAARPCREENAEVHWYDRLIVSYGGKIVDSLKRRDSTLNDAQLLTKMEETHLFDVADYCGALDEAHLCIQGGPSVSTGRV
jgi:hypothetical protein